MIPNSDFKGISLFHVEYFRNDTDGDYKTLAESDMWSSANCAIASELARFSKSCTLFLSKNKCTHLFRSLIIERPGDLMNHDIVDNLL